MRLRTIEDAGRLAVPFTTGILVGIGETTRERAESLFAIREIHRRYRHVQEVIVQNFLAKPGTAMRDAPEPERRGRTSRRSPRRASYWARGCICRRRPNLSDPDQRLRLLDAGIDDWGGVSPLTPDHVNPERPWPTLETLAATTAARGKQLRERLTDLPGVRHEARSLPRRQDARARGRPDRRRRPRRAKGNVREPIPWQDPDVRWKPRTIELSFAKSADAGLRADAQAVYGDFDALEVTRAWASSRRGGADASTPTSAARCARPSAMPPITDDEALALFRAEGASLDALCRVADDLRAEAVGDDVTYVINRNLNFTNVCYVGCRFCAFAQREQDAESYTLTLDEVADRVRGGVGVGRHRGLHAGGHPPGPSRDRSTSTCSTP